jgi:hypothetical protein
MQDFEVEMANLLSIVHFEMYFRFSVRVTPRVPMSGEDSDSSKSSAYFEFWWEWLGKLLQKKSNKWGKLPTLEAHQSDILVALTLLLGNDKQLCGHEDSCVASELCLSGCWCWRFFL